MADQVVASLASWLRSNGAPALVPNRGKLQTLGAMITGPFLLVAFMLRSLGQTVMRRSSSMLQVVPLLLVALTLSFYSTEFWQTIGRLHGLPLVLTTLLFLVLAAAFATRQGRPDLVRLAAFADADELHAALPARLATLVERELSDETPQLRRRERANLIVISVLAQVITAAVIGLIVAAFFIVLGVITIDRVALVSWVGPRPSVLATWTIAGHHYVLSNEMLRVSAFLGAFTGFYFIVTSSTDEAMRADLTAGHERHVRTCLAVRRAYWDAVHRGGFGPDAEAPVS
ncbi:MAG TPA: hypothetical protein VH373_22755 [Jatrophihabitantaceae bacterium]